MSTTNPTTTDPTRDIHAAAQRPTPILEVFKDRIDETADFPVRAFLFNRSDPFALLGLAPAAMDLPEEGRVP